MKDLLQCRQDIDSIDNQILKLLASRMEVARDIAQYKLEHNQGITDSIRELAKLKSLREKASKLGLPGDCITDIYRQIMSHTCAVEQHYIIATVNNIDIKRDTSVAFLGDKGSYSFLAAREYLSGYKGELKMLGCPTFENIVSLVETGRVNYGVLPIENSSSGSINEVLDVLQNTKASFVGELYLNIDHSILASQKVALSEITDVYSHPQPFAQCSEWIKDHLPHAKVHYCKATSEAMQKIADESNPQHVAIGSHMAAQIYNLIPLADNIANNIHNYTRFVIISMTPISIPETLPSKTSLSFSVQKYTPGSLIAVLNEFSKAQINLTKLVSRPRLIPGRDTWEEIFFVDLESNVSSEKMQEILENLHQYTGSLKVLGCYVNAEKK